MSKSLAHPRYWLTWTGLALLWLIAKMPFKVQLGFGKLLGGLLYVVAKRRRHITEVNIKFCFPELSAEQQQTLVKNTLIANATGIVETALGWWGSDKLLKPLVEIKGLEHVKAAQEKGKGILLLGAHFTTLDLIGRFFGYYLDFDITYRQHNNPVMEHFITGLRKKRIKNVIERKQMRRVLKSLKQNRMVWYAGDQDYGPKHAVFAPFFGITAATISATSRLAAYNQSPVLLASHYRKADNSGYVIEISAPFESIPSGDDVADATLINKEFEIAIRKHPEQYMWVHRRFKTRPDGSKNFYD